VLLFEIFQTTLISEDRRRIKQRKTKANEDQFKMYSQDRKYFRFRYRVILVAFLLISPATSSPPKQDGASSLPRFILQCAEIVSALIKDPNGFLKMSDKATIVQGCIKRVPEILEVIEHTAKGPILGAGLLVVSGYLLYESSQLYERAKDLEENYEKCKDDFKLVEDNYTIFNDYIKKDIERHWKNNNTAKMVRNLKTVMEKLTSFFNSLSELADDTRKDIKQISREKTQCFAYFLSAIITCSSVTIVTGNLLVIIPTWGFGVFTLFYNVYSFLNLDKTLEKFQILKKAVMKKRAEINKARASLEVVMMRADINM